jgi:quercetin dioxygenase-like cupin family protein
MSENAAQLFHLDSTPGTSGANSILSQALLNVPHAKVVRFVFSAGQELSEHTATVAALIYQVSGRCRWELGEETKEAAAGDAAYLPPNLKHSLHAAEDSVVLLILLKSSGANA